LSTILAQGDGLVTASRLNVILPKHAPRLVGVLVVGLKSCIQVLDLLVDHTQLQVDASDLGMVLSNASLEDGETAVQVLEALAEVAAIVVVHRQRRVAVANVRVVHAQKTLLKHNGLGLQLNRLQEVTKFELDGRDVCDAVSYVIIHGT